MRDFDYEAPTSLAGALTLLAQNAGRSRPLAGGTDLIDHVRQGRLTPDLLVDIKKIPELNILEASPRGLRIGAAVCCSRIATHPAVTTNYRALADSCRILGGWQIQNRASLGGNLCSSGPAADSTPSLMALDATCLIAGPQGARQVPVASFCTAPGHNVLTPGELLVEFQLPAPAERSASHYRRFIPRNEMDIAVVGVGVSITLEADLQTVQAARIALGAVAPRALLAEEAAALLTGRTVTDDVLLQAGQAARAIATPIDDMRGTRDYRLHLVEVLVKRSLEEAIARARGETVCTNGSH